MFGKYTVKVGGKTVQTKDVGAQTSGWNKYFFTRDIVGDTFELILEKDSGESYMCIKQLEMEIKRKEFYLTTLIDMAFLVPGFKTNL